MDDSIGTAWLCVSAVFWILMVLIAVVSTIMDERRLHKAQRAVERRQGVHLANALAARKHTPT